MANALGASGAQAIRQLPFLPNALGQGVPSCTSCLTRREEHGRKGNGKKMVASCVVSFQTHQKQGLTEKSLKTPGEQTDKEAREQKTQRSPGAFSRAIHSRGTAGGSAT